MQSVLAGKSQANKMVYPFSLMNILKAAQINTVAFLQSSSLHCLSTFLLHLHHQLLVSELMREQDSAL